MELYFEEKTGCLLVYMPEEFDHYMAQKMREGVDEALADERVNRAVFDFANTQFMDSSAIGFLMGRYSHLSAVGGEVSVRNLNPRMRGMLKMAGMQNYIRFEEEEDE